MFLSRIHVDSSPSGNGHDGIRILTVTMDSMVMFYFRKHQSQDCKKGISLILSTIPRDLITGTSIGAKDCWLLTSGFGC